MFVCCDSGLSDDWCVLKTGYCWDVNPYGPYGNCALVFPDDGGVMDCSTSNECTDDANCTGNSTLFAWRASFLV